MPVIGPNIGIPELSPNPFEPLGSFLTYPFVIVSGGNSPYSTMDELATYAQDNDVVLGHFGAPLIPTKVTFALAQQKGFSYAADAAFDMLDCNTLASGAGERSSLTPDTPTVGELDPSLTLALWNGLFVHKDTPADVREKIIAVAEETMASERAQQFAAETGALVYWQNAADTQAQIEADTAALAKINAMLE